MTDHAYGAPKVDPSPASAPLLPCPFCGTAPRLGRTNPPSDIDTPAFYVACLQCGYSRGHFRTSAWEQGRGWYDCPNAEADAIALWNQRAARPSAHG